MPKLQEALKTEPVLLDVNTDQQDKGLDTELVIDRDTASQLKLTAAQIDNTLYDAFGQRTVSTIYESLNQYHVVMMVAQRYYVFLTLPGIVGWLQSEGVPLNSVVTGSIPTSYKTRFSKSLLIW